MVSAVSKATEDTTGTVSLAEAIATKGPDGILFHTRCVLGAADGSVARLVDGATACDIAIEPAEAAAARGLVGTSAVATILVRTNGDGLRVLALQSPSDFDHWWRTRGDGVTAAGVFKAHRAVLDRLYELFS